MSNQIRGEQASHFLAKVCATRRHRLWHETDRQAYGVILSQSGNNQKLGIAGRQQSVGWCEQSVSMCVSGRRKKEI